MREFLLANASVLLFAICVLEAVVFILLAVRLTQLKRNEQRSFAVLSMFVTAGLLFDCGVMVLGSTLSADILMMLSRFRYVLHGLLIPLLLPIGAYGMGWKHAPLTIVWIITLAMMAAGFYMGINVVMEQSNTAGITRLAMAASTPAIAQNINTILSFGTVIPLMIAGIVAIFRKRGPWVLLGGVVMFAFSALGPATGNTDLIFLISAIGEVLMVACFLAHVLQSESKLKAKPKADAAA